MVTDRWNSEYRVKFDSGGVASSGQSQLRKADHISFFFSFFFFWQDQRMSRMMECFKTWWGDVKDAVDFLSCVVLVYTIYVVMYERFATSVGSGYF